MMITAKDLCHECKHYDLCDNECKAGNYIDGLSEYEIVVECDEYTEKDGRTNMNHCIFNIA